MTIEYYGVELSPKIIGIIGLSNFINDTSPTNISPILWEQCIRVVLLIFPEMNQEHFYMIIRSIDRFGFRLIPLDLLLFQLIIFTFSLSLSYVLYIKITFLTYYFYSVNRMKNLNFFKFYINIIIYYKIKIVNYINNQ